MDKKYYIAVSGTRQGPFTLQELINRGLGADTLVWTKGMTDWTEAGQVPELAAALDDEPPALPDTEPAPAPEPPAAPAYVAPEPPREEPREEQERPAKKRGGVPVGKIVGCLLLVIVVVMLFSRPSRERHGQAIIAAVSGYVADQVDSLGAGDVPLLGAALKAGGNSIVSTFVMTNLQVDDYVLWNVGRIKIGETERRVSLGVLGHVLTFDKNDVARAVNAYIEAEQAKLRGEEQAKEQRTVGRKIGDAIDSVTTKIGNVTRTVERVGQVIDDVADQAARLKQRTDSLTTAPEGNGPGDALEREVQEVVDEVTRRLGL